jgi:sister chromatid cohesion protein DCC1
MSLLRVRKHYLRADCEILNPRQGYCLTHVIETASVTTSSLQWFPRTDLPSDPLRRFNDLFLVRPKWKAEDMEPFLEDIAVDKKEREKFLLKFTRASTDDKGNRYYTARANHV